METLDVTLGGRSYPLTLSPEEVETVRAAAQAVEAPPAAAVALQPQRSSSSPAPPASLGGSDPPRVEADLPSVEARDAGQGAPEAAAVGEGFEGEGGLPYHQ